MLPQCSHNCSHIIRKRGIFLYRRRLPRPHVGEVAISLRTTSFWLAQASAEALDVAFEEFFANPAMSEFNIKVALRTYLVEELKQLKARHLATPHYQPVHGAVEDVSYPYDVATVRQVDLSFIDHNVRRLRRRLRERDVRGLDHIANELANGNELADVERVKLSLGVLQAQVQLLKQSRDWLTNGLVGEINLEEEPVLPEAGTKSVVVVSSPKLSEALPAFIDLMVKNEGWRGQTQAQNSKTYSMFMECCGDRPVQEYLREDLAKFYDLLRSLPSLYAKDKQWSALSLWEIAEKSKGLNVERLTMKTMKRHFSALGRFFTYLKGRGQYKGENPAHGFEFPDKVRAKKKRDMWEGEALRCLFSSPVWTGCLSSYSRSRPGSLIIKDEKYWLPILSLFHGTRLEECAQLLRSDVRCEGDIWFLDINDEGDKQVKNEQSIRRVPLHPRVLDLGFLNYLQDVALNDSDQAFPQLQPGGADDKLGHSFTKWWSRYRKDINLYRKGLDYHSFRASVTTKLAAVDVSEEIRNELLGHEGSSVDQKVYLKGLPLKLLADAVARIDWPEFTLDHSYKPGEWRTGWEDTNKAPVEHPKGTPKNDPYVSVK